MPRRTTVHRPATAVPTEAVPITAAGHDERAGARDGADAGARPDADEPGRSSADDATAAPIGGSAAGHLADLQRARAAAFARRSAATPASGVPADVPRVDDAAGDGRAPVPAGPSVPGGPPVGARSDAHEPDAHEAEAHERSARSEHGPHTSRARASPRPPPPAGRRRSGPGDGDSRGRGAGGRRAGDEAPDAADDSTDGPAVAGAGEPTPGRDVRPRPSPRPVLPTGPNGTHRDLTAPGGPYETQLDRAGRNGGTNGAGVSPAPAALPQTGSRPGPQPGQQTGPNTTPLPVVAESATSAGDSVPAADPADALFGASPAPAGDEPVRRSGTGDLGVGRACTAPAPARPGAGAARSTSPRPRRSSLRSRRPGSRRTARSRSTGSWANGPTTTWLRRARRLRRPGGPAGGLDPRRVARRPGPARTGAGDGPERAGVRHGRGRGLAGRERRRGRASGRADRGRPAQATPARPPRSGQCRICGAGRTGVADPQRRKRPRSARQLPARCTAGPGDPAPPRPRAHRFPAGDTRGRHRRHGERRARRGNPMTGPTGPVHIAPAGISPARCSKEGA